MHSRDLLFSIESKFHISLLLSNNSPYIFNFRFKLFQGQMEQHRTLIYFTLIALNKSIFLLYPPRFSLRMYLKETRIMLKFRGQKQVIFPITTASTSSNFLNYYICNRLYFYNQTTLQRL